MNKTDEKINVQGAINSIDVKGVLDFPRSLYKVANIRSTATQLSLDTGKIFKVNASITSDVIKVTRLK